MIYQICLFIFQYSGQYCFFEIKYWNKFNFQILYCTYESYTNSNCFLKWIDLSTIKVKLNYILPLFIQINTDIVLIIRFWPIPLTPLTLLLHHSFQYWFSPGLDFEDSEWRRRRRFAILMLILVIVDTQTVIFRDTFVSFQ